MPDLNAVGWAEYWPPSRYLSYLGGAGSPTIKATVDVSGIMAERYPETVRSITDAGHEVVGFTPTQWI